jgi:hypothetical protein
MLAPLADEARNALISSGGSPHRVLAEVYRSDLHEHRPGFTLLVKLDNARSMKSEGAMLLFMFLSIAQLRVRVRLGVQRFAGRQFLG